VWQFGEQLAEMGRDRRVWMEMQRHLDEKNLKVKKSVVQNASFLTADSGHASADRPRGDESKTRRWHMDKEGWQVQLRLNYTLNRTLITVLSGNWRRLLQISMIVEWICQRRVR